MKLPDFYVNDPTQRMTLSLRTSVLTDLRQYQAYYAKHYGKTPSLNQLLEQMLKQFMADDKVFLKAKDGLTPVVESDVDGVPA